MVMEDNESCGSRVVDSAPTNSRQHSKKLEVYNEVLRRFKQSNNVEAQQPAFDDELWAHFSRLPTRFLQFLMEAQQILFHLALQTRELAEVSFLYLPLVLRLIWKHLLLKLTNLKFKMGMLLLLVEICYGPCMKITFSTDDKPKLLSQLTSLLSEIGLNIQEAHVFSTVDGYSLDVFVVDGWPYEEVEQLWSSSSSFHLKPQRAPSPHNPLRTAQRPTAAFLLVEQPISLVRRPVTTLVVHPNHPSMTLPTTPAIDEQQCCCSFFDSAAASSRDAQ
ncbi:serine/threonine-protein kinase STY46-like [Nicotiana tabacum]|uniref:Serine/threonine-protein kinase STY46-like n=1 Tax=Nicotiana tabacum TaxID=4097 RepID=A0AC58S4Y5_TOBAC